MGLSFAIAAAQAPALRVLADRVELGLDYELHAVGLRHRACAKLAEKRVTGRVGSRWMERQHYGGGEHQAAAKNRHTAGDWV